MPNTPEKLALPAPARTLWREAQHVIHQELQQFGTPRLGGGTTLGARWHHRDSSDVDLTIEPEPGGRPVPVASAIMTPGSRLLSRLENLKIGTVRCEILTEAQFHVTFHNPDDDEIRFGLDIASVSATPRLGAKKALVEGTPAVVLSTTQILTGKLHRWGEATLRDAIDFDHAARRDWENLNSVTFAINTLSSIEANACKVRRMAPEHRRDKNPGQIRNEIRHACRRTWRNHPPVLQETHPAPDWKPGPTFKPGGGAVTPAKAPESAQSALANHESESKKHQQRDGNSQSYTH